MKRKLLLIISSLLLLVLPLIGSFIKWGGFPPGYGFFPARKAHPDIPFDQNYFIFACFVAFLILIFLLFPRLFGFKKVKPEKPTKKNIFPVWFFPSLVVLAVSWFFMWAPIKIFEPISHYTFVPLWWSFILVLDGFVYKRNNGISLISSKPNTVKLLAVVSCVSWFVFEYLNYFVVGNWYYPNYEILTNFGNISWQLVSYTTVLPAIFQWYLLLKTFPVMKSRYSSGPKIKVSKPVMIIALIIGLSSSFFMGLFPFFLFWVLWVSLIPALLPTMSILGYWSPFISISEKGDWTPILLIAIATFLNGFFWEFWNFGSEFFRDGVATNPNYWKYSVPFLDKVHIFSEMPILGYFGYLFFGNVCWILWLVVAYIFGFDPSINLPDVVESKTKKIETNNL